MRKDLTDAVKADLGRGDFINWFCEIYAVEKEIEHTIAHLPTWIKDVVVDTPMLIGPARSKIHYEPLGVVLVMGSWNFPIYTTLAPLVYVIAAGNCAVIKPSEMSPHISKKLKVLITRYLDMSSYVCIEGAVEVAKTLTTKKFDYIVFTGGSEKGKLVAASAAQNLVPVMLELGGKCPAIVDNTADLELAA
jgi:aldehyde dehydrogenase (NAD+)